ncbi:hypothetical protein FSP39_010316 [Pinctada imbricata]|uniref:G-protein coupled receptors family 1 profile domain-containing protein n=1 Tax=Pinctada imbricata TaxID=66713 RepID=A0AA88YI71_PINIB|nr:hypothetical protein FSP39_010316 [Pinctada imbricata]
MNNSTSIVSVLGLNNTPAESTVARPSAFLGDMFTIAAVLGSVGNGFVLFVYFKSSQLQDTTMKLIMHLSLTDLITAVTLGMNVIGVRFMIVKVSYASCLLFMVVPNYMFFVSQSVLAINTMDRYIAICHNDKYARMMTRTTLNVMLVAAWVLPLCLLSLPFYGFNYWDKVQTCLYRNLLHEWVYITNSTVIIFLMFISAFFYIFILRKAWEFHKRFLITHTRGIEEDNERIRAKKRAIKNGKAMGIVALVFTICWLPSNIYQYWFGLNYVPNEVLIMVILFFGTMNCVVNPFIYAWQKEDFRKEAIKILRCGRSPVGGAKVAPMRQEHPKTSKLKTSQTFLTASKKGQSSQQSQANRLGNIEEKKKPERSLNDDSISVITLHH